MASMKDGNDIQEDPPSASKQEGISKERPRASKQEGISKAHKDLQNDPPTSRTAGKPSLIPALGFDGSIFETFTELDCSHPSSSYGYCDFCMLYLPVYRGPPVEPVRRGITPTEDALWFRPRPRP